MPLTSVFYSDPNFIKRRPRKMTRTITNGKLTVSADTHGAELHSLRYDGTEYLWQCGEAWKRYAPVLFPFICSPKNKKYKAGGKEYTMPANHGFARDSEFTAEESSSDSLKFTLCSDDNTRSVYPYDFRLGVEYTFDKDNDDTLCVINTVVNTGDSPMYFYLGGHPAFNCPLDEGLAFDDYYVEYEKPETVIQVWNGTRTILDNENRLNMTRALFDNDVIMKDAPSSRNITLRSDKGRRGVSLMWNDSCKCISVWSPTGDDNASFVCLEPWTSVPVYEDDAFPDIEDKPHAIKLDKGCSFTFDYKIRVF